MTSQTRSMPAVAPSNQRWPRALKIPLAVTLAYLLTGKLALLLALPPGYASAIFPPAGIAVAAAFIGGWRTLPWTFLGSLLLNFWVGYSPSHPVSALGIVVAFMIAFASTLQAALGGWWLRRAVGYPAAFDNAGDVGHFLLLAPAICLVSASVSVTALTALGILDGAGFATNWATWWLGDTLGVLVLVPLVLVVAGEPRSLWRNREYSVAVPMLLAFALFIFVFIKANRWEQEESLTEFRAQSQRMADQIQNHFTAQEFLLEELDGFFSREPPQAITREDFHRFVARSLLRFPDIRGIAWAPRIDHAQRARFEAEQRALVPNYEIQEINGREQRVSAVERPFYYPITYIESQGQISIAPGFDLAAIPDRILVLDLARQRGAPVATVPHLNQETRQHSILLVLPLSRGTAPGVVLSALRIGDFIERIPTYQRSTTQLRLTDIAAREVIFDTMKTADREAGYEQILTYGTRTYRIEFAPTAGYLMQHRGWQSWTVLTAGLFGTGLLGALLMLGTGYTARVEVQVAEFTEELRESSEKLRGLFELSPLGIALTDMKGRFLEFNEAFRAICGYSAEELKALDYWTLTPREYADDEARQLASLDARGSYGPYEKEYVRKDGKRIPLSLNGVLLNGKNGEKFIWSIIEDITDKKLADKHIHHQARHDILTGLPNRMLYADRLQQAVSIAKRDRSRLALIYIDLDKFKHANDTLGHKAGDELLQAAATRMQGCVRESDTVARIGGDEFVVLLPSIKCEEDALRVAEKIRHALARPFELTEHQLNISASIGVAIYPEHGEDEEQLFHNADRAMYYAKRKGRDNVQLYHDGIGDFSEATQPT